MTTARNGDLPVSIPQSAWSFETEVGADGRIELSTPLPPRSRVRVFVVEQVDEFADLVNAANSSLGFWDNPLDDEVWSATP